jgi:hypothetical protein
MFARIGGALVALGLGSILLRFFDMDFEILQFLGEGMTSRIVIAVVGVALIVIGMLTTKKNNSGTDSSDTGKQQ